MQILEFPCVDGAILRVKYAGESLDLRGTAITALPEGLTVGKSLDLRGTAITALPEGLTVGESLYLRGTAITALPEGLTVGVLATPYDVYTDLDDFNILHVGCHKKTFEEWRETYTAEFSEHNFSNVLRKEYIGHYNYIALLQHPDKPELLIEVDE
jgi:hypothetical protein